MPRYRSIYTFNYGIFDMDGTLIDSLPKVSAMFGKVVERHLGINADYVEEFYLRNTHMLMSQTIMKLAEMFKMKVAEKEIDSIRWEFEENFLKVPVDFFPGAISALKKLHGSGMVLFLSSLASSEMVNKRLQHGKISGLFNIKLGSDKIRKGPEHFGLFARSLGLTPEEFARHTFFCGDMEYDMQVAKAAGFYPIGIRGTTGSKTLRKAGAIRVVDSVATLARDKR